MPLKRSELPERTYYRIYDSEEGRKLEVRCDVGVWGEEVEEGSGIFEEYEIVWFKHNTFPLEEVLSHADPFERLNWIHNEVFSAGTFNDDDLDYDDVRNFSPWGTREDGKPRRGRYLKFGSIKETTQNGYYHTFE